MGFRSGLSGGVRHQLIPLFSMKAWALLDVCLGSLSCISMLVASSFFRIWSSTKAFASADSVFGLPDRGRFLVEPVCWIFLTILVTLEKLACQPSLFTTLTISTGRKPSLKRQSILFLVYVVTFGMIAEKWVKQSLLPWQKKHLASRRDWIQNNRTLCEAELLVFGVFGCFCFEWDYVSSVRWNNWRKYLQGFKPCETAL